MKNQDDEQNQNGPSIPPPLSGGPSIPPPLSSPKEPSKTEGVSPPAADRAGPRAEDSAAQSSIPNAPKTPPTAPAGNQQTYEGITFAAYRYADQIEPDELLVEPVIDDEVRISWSPAQEPSFYRLVFSDREWPFSPDSAEELAVTSADSFVSRRPFNAAVRYFQVWRYSGDDIYEARIRQPQLHAQGHFIVGVRGGQITPDGNQIIARWNALPGTNRVNVNRVLRKDIASGLKDSRSQILSEFTNLTGFVDSDVDTGQRYVYQVRSEVDVDSMTQLSAPDTFEVDVPFALEPVLDLNFTLHDGTGHPTFDLEWTPPRGGEVRIYRSDMAPVAGLRKAAVPLRALEHDAKLREEDWINRPVQFGSNGSVIMNGVPWPEGWTRAYFTAVVVHEDEAFVGNTVHGVRVPPVEDVQVTERVGVKLVHFHWPQGVDVVQAFVGQKSDGPPPEGTTPYAEIDEKTYRDSGGLHIRGDGNLRYGGVVYLTAISFSEGRRVSSISQSVEIDPLLIIGYDISLRTSIRGKGNAQISVFAHHEEIRQSVPFVLVHNSERLPLTAQDGTVLPVRPVDADSDASSAQFAPPELLLRGARDQAPQWLVDQNVWDSKVQGGYLRVFVAVPPDALKQVALLDPPVKSLTVNAESRTKRLIKGFRRG